MDIGLKVAFGWESCIVMFPIRSMSNKFTTVVYISFFSFEESQHKQRRTEEAEVKSKLYNQEFSFLRQLAHLVVSCCLITEIS